MVKSPFRSLQWAMMLARRLSTVLAAEAADMATATATAAAAEHQSLYQRLSSLSANRGGTVAETMNKWLKEGKVVRENDIYPMVRELRRYKSYSKALELMDWMETRGMNISFSNHAVRLHLISKVKGMDLAESYFDSLPELAKSKLTYGALLNCYCQHKMQDKALALFEKMKELNLASSELAYNSLMTLFMKLDQPKKVWSLFEQMKSNNLSPDRFTYCTLMNSYASLNDIDSIEKIIQDMIEGKITLHWSIYSHLASHYNSAGLFEKANRALKKVEELMAKHDREAWHYLLTLYAGAGNLAEVNRVWKSLRTAFKKTTNMSFLLMLRALVKLDDMDAVKQCFKEWESVHLLYDIKLVNVVIGAYLQKGMIKEAESLWEKATERGHGSDFRTYELFVDYYLKSSEMDLALQCFEAVVSKVQQDEWKPNKDMLITFLKYYEEGKDVDGVKTFCKCLEKLNCLDAEVEQYLLRTCLAAGDSSFNQQIKERFKVRFHG